MKRIQTKDRVIVIAGKNKGQTGIVKQVLENKVLVEGLNMIKKHVKPNPQLEQKGGIIEKEAPIHVSNIALLDPSTQKAGKIGFRFEISNEKKQKVRYFKSSNDLVHTG